MTTTACIILNYNDSDNTERTLLKIKSYDVFRYIIVVDNQSTDESYAKLLEHQSERVHIVQTKKNGGFGYGNNFGVLIAKKLGAQYALIINPDVDFNNDIIHPMLNVFCKHKDAVVVVPASFKDGHVRAYHTQSNIQIVASSSLLLNKLFANKLGRFKDDEILMDRATEIGVFSGALFMIDIDRFINIGMFDEQVFLYFEESILAEKIHKHDCKIYMLPNVTFQHIGSQSVKKNIASFTKIKKYEIDSKKYFLRHYRNIKSTEEIFYSFLFSEALFEMWLYRFSKNRGLRNA